MIHSSGQILTGRAAKVIENAISNVPDKDGFFKTAYKAVCVPEEIPTEASEVYGTWIEEGAEGKHLSFDELRLLHSKKTGALIRAAVLMGAACADNATKTQIEKLDEYAKWTGLAFQVWDDILDVIGDTAVMGKTQGSDISLDKSTYPALLGIDKAKAFAHECAQKAIASLKDLAIDTSLLEQFALFAVNRDH